MPLFRRIPKRGFSNFNFARRYEIVNVSQLELFFDDGSTINAESLVGVGLVDSLKSKIKILGDGQLTKKLEVTAQKFSKSAEQKISGCGGTAKVVA
jgi:large subunit ribosomal protein L15